MDRTILVVDDVRSNREILKKILGNEYDIIEAADGKEALSVMLRENKRISAVILDLGMPEMNGFEVLQYVRGNVTLKQLPIIVTTGLTDSDSEEKALRLGAKDYISKPYKPAIIRQRIRNTIDLRENAATVNALRYDSLTGLYSRAAFFERVREMVNSREAGYYIISCFDIEKFKVVNDQYGNAKGDEALKHIARVFSEGYGEVGGVCCRVTGDDFAVIYPAYFHDSEKAARIRKRAANIDWLASPMVFSIGRYLIDDKSLSPSAMYDRATMAADSVKGRYDSQIAFYDNSMRDRLIYEQEIVTEMEQALKERQFEIWLQPQFNHSDKTLIGAEALVRWRHPEKGLIPPGIFVPVFEQNGFIYELDKFIWREACRLMRKWIDEGANPAPISVNMSRYDVFRDDVIDVITSLVEEYKLGCDMLRIEITESAFAQNTKHIVRVVKRLIDKGFTIEIDDFGSGYSSLNTLKSVPAQVLKLDMRFLENDDDAQRGGSIIESMVRMTKWLGMSVIAEGVEKIEQADYLRSIGCNYIQGYLYAKPMPAAEYEKTFKSVGRQSELITIQTVENLNNNSFWDPKSMDTLIFNSYVGAACIFEYREGNIELLRATEKYAQVIGSAGMTVEDALKLNWAEHLSPESAEKFAANIRRSIAEKCEICDEYVFLDLPNCPHETYLRSTTRVIAMTGNRYLVYCTNENITAQRNAEQREQTLIDQLQAILDNVNCGMTAVKIDGENIEYLLTNDRYYELLGYTKYQYEREIGSRAMDTIFPADREKVAGIIARVQSTGLPATMEYRVLTRSGGVSWLKSSMSMSDFAGVEGKVQLCTYTNITADKNARLRERRTSEQFEAILSDIGTGITASVVRNGEIKFIFSNDRFYEMFGLVREGFDAEAMYGRIIPGDRRRVRDLIAKSRATLAHVKAEFRVDVPGAGEKWLRMNMSSTRFTGVEESVNLCTVSDITAEKSTEEELLDNLPHGSALFNYENGVLSVAHLNKRYWELVGRESTEYDGAAFMSVIHPDDKIKVLENLMTAIRENRDVLCEMRVLNGLGEYKPFRVAGRIVKKGNEKYSIYASYTSLSDEAESIREMLPVALKTMMETQTGFSFVKDAQCKYICSSRSIWQAAKCADESGVIGKSDYDLLDKYEADIYAASDAIVLKTGNSLIDHIDVISVPNGATRYTMTSKYPLRDSRGDIIGVYGTGRDVTEAQIMRSRFDLLTSAVPGGIACYKCPTDDPAGMRLTYFSDGFCRLFGYERDEYNDLVDKNPYGTVLKEDIPLVRAHIIKLIQTNAPQDFVFRAGVKGGMEKWINVKALGEESDGIETINTVMFDVTVQQEALEKLRVSEEENRLAIAHSGCIICRYTVEDKTARLLPEVAKAFAIPEAVYNVPYKPVEDGLIAPDSAKAYIEFYEKILGGEKTGEAVYRESFREGWRWMRARFSTIFSDAGKPVSAVISFFDVTEEQEKEAAYKKWQQSYKDKNPATYTLFCCNLSKDASFDTVEGTLLNVVFDEKKHSFDERTKEYVEQCVFEDDKIAYLAFLDSDTLLANYYRGKRSGALEYRETRPDGRLRWLKLTVDLIEYPNSTDVEAYLMYEDITDDKLDELQTREMAENDPLTGILNRKTFISRCTAQINALKPGQRHALIMLDIDGFKQVNDVFGHGAGDKTLIDTANAISGALRRDDLFGRLGGDEFLVFLKDIPSDAVAAMKARQICALTRKAFSLEVQISASLGIAVAPRDGTDFDTLYKKVDSALYYVKGSGKDNYAFFREDMRNEHLQPEKSPEGEKRESGETKKRRMLIVDDSVIDNEILTNIFKDEFIIEKAKDGNSALIRLRHYSHAISVVLLDLIMPGLDGFAVLDKMRSSAELRSIPVIVVSGDNDRETNLKTIKCGASDFITKPVDADLLRLRVHSAVSKAENERLRLQNSFLEFQNSVITRYKTVLERSKTAIVELEWQTERFIYDPSLPEIIAGVFDSRELWKILADDGAADKATVETMRRLVNDTARAKSDGESAAIKLKAPDGTTHPFVMTVYKTVNDIGRTDKLYISLHEAG